MMQKIALLSVTLGLATVTCGLGADRDSFGGVEQWGVYEIVLAGPASPQAYLEVAWLATFSQGARPAQRGGGSLQRSRLGITFFTLVFRFSFLSSRGGEQALNGR